MVFGYIRIFGYIPIDIIELIKFFYGKKYYIFGPSPLNDEFDFAVEILTPISMLGITHNHNTICSCTSDFAKKNIIVGSTIIQMNDQFIDENVHKNDWRIMSKIFKEIKQKTPSCIIFRHKKSAIDKGLHFQIDVRFKSDLSSTKNKERFPYYKFTKTQIKEILDKAFDDNDLVQVYQIYGYKKGGGVAILFFVHDQDRKLGYFKDELIKKEKAIESIFKKYFEKEFIISCRQQLYERRGNKLHNGFSNVFNEEEFMNDKQTIMSLIYTVKGIDDGRNAWYLVLCDPDKLEIFLKELNAPIIHLEDHGYIIKSSYGDDMPKAVEQTAFKMFDF